MSFPCGLEHLRRCTGSTRWWSVDCGKYANRGTLALFISLGRFRLIGTYNQFFYTPQSSQSHSYLLAFPFPCAIADWSPYSKPSYLPVASKLPVPSTCPFSLTLLTLHYDYHLPFLFSATGRPMLSSEYNSPRTRHDLYAPTLFFSLKSFNFPSHLGELYNPFMFSTLLFIFHDPDAYRFSLPTRCGSSLHPTTSSQPGKLHRFPGCT